MKRFLIYISLVMLAMLTIPSLCGCEKGDDLKVIFTGKTWKMSYIFREGDPKAYVNFWGDDREAEAESIATQKLDGNYELEFTGANIDGAFTGAFSGKGVKSSFTGTWRADAEKRVMSTYDMRWTGNESDVLAKQFQKCMDTTFKYSGDSNALYLYYKDGEVTYVMALLPKNRK
jgi:hypothetical protein